MAQISPERRARMNKEKQQNASGGGNYFSFKNLTKAQIRLVPLAEDENIGTKVVYYFINNKSYICNEQTNGKPGVIARTIRALQKLDHPDAAKLVEGFQRKSRFLMKIIDRAEPDKVMWAEAPKAIYDVIFKVFDEDGEDVSDAREGRDFRISKTGSGLNTEYSARALDKSPLHEDKATRAAIIEAASNFVVADELRSDEARTLEAIKGVIPKEVWSKISAEVVKGVDGLDEAADDDEDADSNAADEDETPPPKAKKPAPADEDDETPPPKAKKPAAPPADEDDETPPPKPKKPAVAADDDEDAPVAKPKPKAPPADEDDETPPAKPKKPAPVADDDDDVPPAKPKKPAAPADDDEDETPPAKPKADGRKRFQVNDDD